MVASSVAAVSSSSRGVHAAPPIIGAVVDALCFWGAPVLALPIGFLLALIPANAQTIAVNDQPVLLTALFASSITHAHLVIVGFRSHGNAAVFKQFPLRFLAVPAAVFLAGMFSTTALVVLILVNLFWDAYHTAMQSFGLGRIYDAKAGADRNKDRLVDAAFHIAVYTIPWLVGPVFALALPAFESLWNAHVTFLDPLVRFRLEHKDVFESSVFVIVPVAVTLYALRQVQRIKRGEPISWQKLALCTTTTLCSVWCFTTGFFGQALLVVNLFHAVQYFAIVHATEKKTLARMFGARTLIGLVVVGALYGVGVASLLKYWVPATALLSLINTVSLMHFWYDGFIWSVRKRQV